MKKVLVVFDGEHFSKGALDFAIRLNEKQPVLLTGVFLSSVGYKNVEQYYGGMEAYIYRDNTDYSYDEEVVGKSIAQFKEVCEHNGIEHRVHNQMNGSFLEALSRETRFADLMVLSTELFYSNIDKKAQQNSIEDAVHQTECPVILLPENYNFPGSIILAYDGSESSVFAIKQFAYLFPELAALSTIVVYASEKRVPIPDFDYIKELSARHFSNLEFLKLDVAPEDYFNVWFKNTKDPMLVVGSYSRSAFSEMFKDSFASEIIKEHKFPVFIAHK